MAVHSYPHTAVTDVTIPASFPGGTIYVPSWHEGIVRKAAAAKSTYAMIHGRAKWVKYTHPKVQWSEEAEEARTDQANDATLGAVTAATWMTVDNPSRWSQNLKVRNRTTGELMQVTQVDEANSRVYLGERGIGAVAVAGIADNAVFELFNRTQPERASLLAATSIAPTNYVNYMETSADTTDMSQALLNVAASNMAKVNMYDERKDQKTVEFMVRQVANFYRGQADIIGSGTVNGPTYHSGGAIEFLENSTANYDFGGHVLTYGELLDALTNAQIEGYGTEYDLIMRPEILAEFSKLFDMKTVPVKLDKTIEIEVEAIKLGRTTFRLHEDYVLSHYDIDHVFGLQVASKMNGPRGKAGIEMAYAPVRSDPDVLSGKPTWTSVSQNGGSVKTEQILANYCPLFLGHSWGAHFMLKNIAHV